MCGRKKSSPLVDMDQSDKNSIEWCKEILTSFEEQTRPESMTKLDNGNPLDRAFELSHKIRNLKRKRTEMKSELKDFIKKTKKFTVDLLDACENHEDVAAVLNFGENDGGHKEKVKTLKEAIAARHKEVS